MYASQSLGQVCSSEEKLSFSFFFLPLSVLAAFPCVPSQTLLPWKRSRETVQAAAQKREALFVHLQKDVGMVEILPWLDADLYSF